VIQSPKHQRIMPTAPTVSRDPALEAHLFWWRFRREIVAVIVVALLALAFFGVYRLYTDRRASSAASLLASARGVSDYEQLIARYSNTPAAASGYLLLAETQHEEKKFAEANATLRAFIDKNPNHELVPTAEMAIGANLESMGKSDEAFSIYQGVAAKYPQNFNAPLALISEVSILKAKNRIDEARRVCEEVLMKYRMPGDQRAGARDDRVESFWVSEAMRQLHLLKPSAPPEAPTKSAIPPLLAAPSAAPAAPPRPRPSATSNKPHD
jgi:predicted negative regulator of RcsB-dependent stress response